MNARTFAGVVGAEGIGLKYSRVAPSAPSSASSAARFGVLAVAACGVDNEGVARLLLPGVLKKAKDPVTHHLISGIHFVNVELDVAHCRLVSNRFCLTSWEFVEEMAGLERPT